VNNSGKPIFTSYLVFVWVLPILRLFHSSVPAEETETESPRHAKLSGQKRVFRTGRESSREGIENQPAFGDRSSVAQQSAQQSLVFECCLELVARLLRS